jgi:hypothetical protein
MKKPIVALVTLIALFVGFTYEWRYSDEMKNHIDSVNRDLESTRLEATYSTGLLGSLQAMTSESNVAGEIIETHEYVHTLKDEVLAWKIKKSVEQCNTVGEAIQTVIAKWSYLNNR